MGEWKISETAVDDPASTELLRTYFTELVGRFINRIATRDEVDAAIEDEPSAGLVPPHGTFLVAQYDGRPAGCVGLRLIGPGTVELTRLFVHPDLRRRGGASALLTAAEDRARDLGADLIRLETRNDLSEAQLFYAAHGYVEIPGYPNSTRYADHCFEKRLLRDAS